MDDILKRKIIQKLEEQALTQSDLSKKTGLSRSLVNKTLNLTTNPGIFTISKIAEALNCTIDELIGNPESKIKHKNYTIEDPLLLREIVDFLVNRIYKEKHTFSIDQFFNCINEIYKYSLKSDTKNRINLKFANWYFESKLK